MDQEFYKNYRKRKPDRNPGCLGWFMLILILIGMLSSFFASTGSNTSSNLKGRSIPTYTTFNLPPRTPAKRPTATPAPKSNTVSAAAVGGIMNQIQRSVTATPKAKVTYILNRSTKVFHKPSCRDVGKMSPRNQIDFTGTKQQAIEKGYRPCGHCHP